MASDPHRGQRGTSGSGSSSGSSDQTGPEDRKPQSDEAHSAFTPPLGVPYPPLPEDEHPTSEFALPAGLRPESLTEQEGSAFTTPSGTTGQTPLPVPVGATALSVAFTPPHGIPAVSLTKEAPWQDRMRTMLRMPVHERPVPERPDRGDEETGPAVPRVLDLTLRIGEILLAAW